MFHAPREIPNLNRQVARAALAVARDEVGHGETTGNNAGPDVERYRGGRGGSGAWCAAFVSYCYLMAANLLGRRLLFKVSHGAKRLAKNVAAAGRWVDLSWEAMEPGDLIAWDRGVLPWQGHIAIVVWYDQLTRQLTIVEGNAGKFPAKVRLRTLQEKDWRRRLWRVARYC